MGGEVAALSVLFFFFNLLGEKGEIDFFSFFDFLGVKSKGTISAGFDSAEVPLRGLLFVGEEDFVLPAESFIKEKEDLLVFSAATTSETGPASCFFFDFLLDFDFSFGLIIFSIASITASNFGLFF